MVKARKRFGQHFLSRDWARKVLDAIAPRPEDVFIEIGAGQGALTWALAERTSRVIAVEIDRDLVVELTRAAPPNVTIVPADILNVDLAALIQEHAGDAKVRVAGNLPYNISSPIIFQLLDTHRRCRALIDATVMLQREVVERLAARPGTKDYGVLTVLTRVLADVDIRLRLPPGAFRPIPKVWSAVARLTFTPPKVQVADIQRFEETVKGLFAQRRKTVLNAVRRIAPEGVDATGLLARASIDPRRRPETLDLPELSALAELLRAEPRRAVL